MKSQKLQIGDKVKIEYAKCHQADPESYNGHYTCGTCHKLVSDKGGKKLKGGKNESEEKTKIN